MPNQYTGRDRTAHFWSRVDKSAGPSGCWPWMGGRMPSGYCQVRWNGRKQQAHRVAFLLSGRTLTDEKPLVLHGAECKGNGGRACCNPAHLSAGDHADNLGRDRRRDGTLPTGDRHGWHTHPELRPRGEANGSAVLASLDIPGIRASSAAGESQRSIAHRLGVSKAAIQRVLSGRTWSHVP